MVSPARFERAAFRLGVKWAVKYGIRQVHQQEAVSYTDLTAEENL